MTTEDLKEYVDAFAAEVSGRVLALMHVLRIMQSQAGYDHERFRATLATLDVCGEEAQKDGPSPMTPEQKRAFDDTVKVFLDSPTILPEEWISRIQKPAADA